MSELNSSPSETGNPPYAFHNQLYDTSVEILRQGEFTGDSFEATIQTPDGPFIVDDYNIRETGRVEPGQSAASEPLHRDALDDGVALVTIQNVPEQGGDVEKHAYVVGRPQDLSSDEMFGPVLQAKMDAVDHPPDSPFIYRTEPNTGLLDDGLHGVRVTDGLLSRDAGPDRVIQGISTAISDALRPPTE